MHDGVAASFSTEIAKDAGYVGIVEQLHQVFDESGERFVVKIRPGDQRE